MTTGSKIVSDRQIKNIICIYIHHNFFYFDKTVFHITLNMWQAEKKVIPNEITKNFHQTLILSGRAAMICSARVRTRLSSGAAKPAISELNDSRRLA